MSDISVSGYTRMYDAMEAAELTERQREATQALRYANSYDRAYAIINMFLVRHPFAQEALVREWDGCDHFPKGAIPRMILRDMPCPAPVGMDPDEQAYLAQLPEVVDIWRGCYPHNRAGFAWTADRKVAETFPFLNRYWHADRTPILLHGRVRRTRIIFVRLDRGEFEVVPRPGCVKVIAEYPLDRDGRKRLEESEARRLEEEARCE